MEQLFCFVGFIDVKKLWNHDEDSPFQAAANDGQNEYEKSESAETGDKTRSSVLILKAKITVVFFWNSTYLVDRRSR